MMLSSLFQSVGYSRILAGATAVHPGSIVHSSSLSPFRLDSTVLHKVPNHEGATFPLRLHAYGLDIKLFSLMFTICCIRMLY